MSEPIALSAVDGRSASIRHNPLIDLISLVIRPRAVPTTSPTLIWIKRHPLLLPAIMMLTGIALANLLGGVTTQMLLLSVPSGS